MVVNTGTTVALAKNAAASAPAPVTTSTATPTSQIAPTTIPSVSPIIANANAAAAPGAPASTTTPPVLVVTPSTPVAQATPAPAPVVAPTPITPTLTWNGSEVVGTGFTPNSTIALGYSGAGASMPIGGLLHNPSTDASGNFTYNPGNIESGNWTFEAINPATGTEYNLSFNPSVPSTYAVAPPPLVTPTPTPTTTPAPATTTPEVEWNGVNQTITGTGFNPNSTIQYDYMTSAGSHQTLTTTSDANGNISLNLAGLQPNVNWNYGFSDPSGTQVSLGFNPSDVSDISTVSSGAYTSIANTGATEALSAASAPANPISATIPSEENNFNVSVPTPSAQAISELKTIGISNGNPIGLTSVPPDATIVTQYVNANAVYTNPMTGDLTLYYVPPIDLVNSILQGNAYTYQINPTTAQPGSQAAIAQGWQPITQPAQAYGGAEAPYPAGTQYNGAGYYITKNGAVSYISTPAQATTNGIAVQVAAWQPPVVTVPTAIVDPTTGQVIIDVPQGFDPNANVNNAALYAQAYLQAINLSNTNLTPAQQQANAIAAANAAANLGNYEYANQGEVPVTPIPQWYTLLQNSLNTNNKANAILLANLSAVGYNPAYDNMVETEYNAPIVAQQTAANKAAFLASTVGQPSPNAVSLYLPGTSIPRVSQTTNSPFSLAPLGTVLTPQTTRTTTSPVPANTILSSLQPLNSIISYVGKDIITLPSEIQNAINVAAATPYNPANPLSTAYWENTIGDFAQMAEYWDATEAELATPVKNLITGKYNNIQQDLKSYANLQSQMTTLVNEGVVPWYFPDVANLMIAAPLLVTSYEETPEISVFLQNVATGAGGLTAINAITNLILGKPITAQSLTQSAVTGATVGGILSPLSTILTAPLTSLASRWGLYDVTDALAEYGIPGKIASYIVAAAPEATQEAFNLGNFFAAITATQLLNNGMTPTAKQLEDSYFYGAALGAGLGEASAIAEGLTSALEDIGFSKEISAGIGTGTKYGIAGTGQAALGAVTGSPLSPLENFAIGVGLSASPEVWEALPKIEYQNYEVPTEGNEDRGLVFTMGKFEYPLISQFTTGEQAPDPEEVQSALISNPREGTASENYQAIKETLGTPKTTSYVLGTGGLLGQTPDASIWSASDVFSNSRAQQGLLNTRSSVLFYNAGLQADINTATNADESAKFNLAAKIAYAIKGLPTSSQEDLSFVFKDNPIFENAGITSDQAAKIISDIVTSPEWSKYLFNYGSATFNAEYAGARPAGDFETFLDEAKAPGTAAQLAQQIADALNSASTNPVWTVDNGRVNYVDPETGMTDHLVEIKAKSITTPEENEATPGLKEPSPEKTESLFGYKETADESTELGGVKSRTGANQVLAKENSAFAPKLFTSADAYNNYLNDLIETSGSKGAVLDDAAKPQLLEAVKQVFDIIRSGGDPTTAIENYRTVVNQLVEADAIRGNSEVFMQYKVPYLMEQLSEYPETFEFTNPTSYRFKDNYDAVVGAKLVDYAENNGALQDNINQLAEIMVRTGDLSPKQYQDFLNVDPATTPLTIDQLGAVNELVATSAPLSTEEATGADITPATQAAVGLAGTQPAVQPAIQTQPTLYNAPLGLYNVDPSVLAQIGINESEAASIGLTPLQPTSSVVASPNLSLAQSQALSSVAPSTSPGYASVGLSSPTASTGLSVPLSSVGLDYSYNVPVSGSLSSATGYSPYSSTVYPGSTSSYNYSPTVYPGSTSSYNYSPDVYPSEFSPFEYPPITGAGYPPKLRDKRNRGQRGLIDIVRPYSPTTFLTGLNPDLIDPQLKATLTKEKVNRGDERPDLTPHEIRVLNDVGYLKPNVNDAELEAIEESGRYAPGKPIYTQAQAYVANTYGKVPEGKLLTAIETGKVKRRMYA